MSTLVEIEAAVEKLARPQQEELLRHLEERLEQRRALKRKLPLVLATGRPITQQEIVDALDAA
jgi:hypothetical protein